MSYPTVGGDAVEGTPLREPQVCLGPSWGGSYYQFSASGTNTANNIYQDGALTTPFPTTGFVVSNAYGRFPAIYLDPSVTYRVRFFNKFGAQQWQSDPYGSQLSTVGTSSLSAYGFQIAPTGEITIPAPNSGGTGISLTLNAGSLGTSALQISANLPGNSALIVNSSATTGVRTATFTATNKPGTATSSPAGWLPITCDGVQYYTPIWHGNNFSPYVANPTALGEIIVASTVTFGSTGLTTVTGGTATPSNWFSPTSVGIGAGYYINITKTGGLSGLAFSAAQGSWVNISGSGLTISSNAQATIAGTYNISSSVSGTPIVASGTITLSNNNGIQSPTYNGATPLVLAGNGTATINGGATSNWYAPTTANVGSGYWILISQTGGTTGYSFSAGTGAYTNITNGGLTIAISGTGSVSPYVQGTYIIASDSGGVNQLGSGTIYITGSPVQSPNWSGTTPLKLNGNGTATLNGSGTSSWYSPTTSNVGSGYWIDITRTGGTAGSVNFSAAQGSWTNITNSGLTIDMTGYTGNVAGTATVNGTWQISSSSGGTPVLGSGTIQLSISGLTVLTVKNVHGSGTVTAPPGTTNVVIELWGAGGGGGGAAGQLDNPARSGGGAGGGPGYSRTSIACSGGKTINYSLATGGAGGAAGGSGSSNGSNGGAASGASTVTSGTLTITTMTANAGGVGLGGTGSYGAATGGAGGTASGGTQANTTGGVGQTGDSLGDSATEGQPGNYGVNYNVFNLCFGGGGGIGGGSVSTAGGAGSDGIAVFYFS